MSYRFLASVGALAAVTTVLSLAQVSVAGQAPAAATKTAAAQTRDRTPLRTSWGDPDLQGIWTAEYQTPLQRPARYAGKEFFTENEIAELDRQRAALLRRDYRAERGSEADVGGAYNALYNPVKPTGRRTSLIVDPPDGRIPPLTPEAQKRRAAIREFQLALLQATDLCKNKQPGVPIRNGVPGGATCVDGQYGPPSPRRAEQAPYYVTNGGLNRADGPEDQPLGTRCLSGQLPDFSGYRRIVQSPGQIVIIYEGWQRIIPLTTSAHLPPHIRQWWGDSRGRWEGNTLVVDVTNFSPKADFQGSRENLHLLERWTRVDANTLEYTVTIEDPTTWTKPWTAKQELNKQSDQANRLYSEPRCHEGNYGLLGLLAGARATETAFTEGRGPDPATLCIAFGGNCGGLQTEDNQDPLEVD
jgi:hypothetical protein